MMQKTTLECIADERALVFLQCARSNIKTAIGAIVDELPQFKGLSPNMFALQAKRELSKALKILKDVPHVR